MLVCALPSLLPPFSCLGDPCLRGASPTGLQGPSCAARQLEDGALRPWEGRGQPGLTPLARALQAELGALQAIEATGADLAELAHSSEASLVPHPNPAAMLSAPEGAGGRCRDPQCSDTSGSECLHPHPLQSPHPGARLAGRGQTAPPSEGPQGTISRSDLVVGTMDLDFLGPQAPDPAEGGPRRSSRLLPSEP